MTGAARYLENRRNDPDYDRAYAVARKRIKDIDTAPRSPVESDPLDGEWVPTQ